MEFTSFVYIIFLLIGMLFYYALPKKCQWAVLLALSLAYYVIFSGALIAFMLACTLAVYLGARRLEGIDARVKAAKGSLEKAEFKELKKKSKKSKRGVLTAVVVFTLAMLAVLKYCNLFGSIVNSVTALFGRGNVVPVFSLLLPLGISYYTLMSISYITDVYRGRYPAEKNFFMLLLFVCYFPHITEGPFDRYDALSAQFRQEHKFDYEQMKNGALLVMFGIAKKLVIADRAGVIASGIFEKSGSLGGTAIFLGMLIYTLQLYADFSGCIDIVSGSSELFGIKLAENFRQPFFSRSVNEFWRRWHITLGTFLKDYVFYSVAPSSGTKNITRFAKKHFKSDNLRRVLPAAYALFFVWFCNGLWHGASGKYIAYGLYYYVIMMFGEFMAPVFNGFYKKTGLNRDGGLCKAFQLTRTFLLVNVGMLLFRSATLGEFASLLIKMFSSVSFSQLFNGSIGIEGISYKDYIVLAVGIAALLIIGLLKEKGVNVRESLDSKPLALRWVVYLLLIFSAIIFGIYGGNFENAGMIYAEF